MSAWRKRRANLARGSGNRLHQSSAFQLPSRGASTLVQYAGKSLPPSDAEAGRDFYLIGQLRAIVRPQPGRQRFQRPGVLCDRLGEGKRQLARYRS